MKKLLALILAVSIVLSSGLTAYATTPNTSGTTTTTTTTGTATTPPTTETPESSDTSTTESTAESTTESTAESTAQQQQSFKSWYEGTGLSSTSIKDIPHFAIKANDDRVFVRDKINAVKLPTQPILGSGITSGRILAPIDLYDLIDDSVVITQKPIGSNLKFKPVLNPNSSWYGWYLPVAEELHTNGTTRPKWNASSHGDPCGETEAEEKYRVLTTIEKKMGRYMVASVSIEWFVEPGKGLVDKSFETTSYMYFKIFDKKFFDTSNGAQQLVYNSYKVQAPFTFTSKGLVDIKSVSTVLQYYLSDVDSHNKVFAFKQMDGTKDQNYSYAKDMTSKNTGSAESSTCEIDEKTVPKGLWNIKEGFPYGHNDRNAMVSMNEMTTALSNLSVSLAPSSVVTTIEDEAQKTYSFEYDDTVNSAIVKMFESGDYYPEKGNPSSEYAAMLEGDNPDVMLTPIRSASSNRPNNIVLLDDLVGDISTTYYINKTTDRLNTNQRNTFNNKFNVLTMDNPFVRGMFNVSARRLHSSVIKKTGRVDVINITEAMVMFDSYGNIVARRYNETGDAEIYLLYPNYLNPNIIKDVRYDANWAGNLYVEPSASVINDKIELEVRKDDAWKSLIMIDYRYNSSNPEWRLGYPRADGFSSLSTSRVKADIYDVVYQRGVTHFTQLTGDAQYTESEVSGSNGNVYTITMDMVDKSSELSYKDYLYYSYLDTDERIANEIGNLVVRDNVNYSTGRIKILNAFHLKVIRDRTIAQGTNQNTTAFGSSVARIFDFVAKAGAIILMMLSILGYCLWYVFRNFPFTKTDWSSKLSFGFYNRDMQWKHSTIRLIVILTLGGMVYTNLLQSVLMWGLTFILNIFSAFK